MDRPSLRVGREFALAVDRLPDHVPEASQRRLPDRNRDRLAGVDDVDPAREPVGRVHCDRADAVVPEVLLHLGHERARLELDLERGQDLRKAVGEDGVDDDALDLDDLPGVPAGLLVGHCPSSKRRSLMSPACLGGRAASGRCESSSGSPGASCEPRLNPPGYPVDPAPARCGPPSVLASEASLSPWRNRWVSRAVSAPLASMTSAGSARGTSGRDSNAVELRADEGRDGRDGREGDRVAEQALDSATTTHRRHAQLARLELRTAHLTCEAPHGYGERPTRRTALEMVCERDRVELRRLPVHREGRERAESLTGGRVHHSSV